MRNVFLTALLLFSVAAVQAQWKKLGGGNQGPELRSVYFVNGKVGYVCGGFVGTSSTIAKTLDGGGSWTVTSGTVTGVLRAIHCIDENTCIACGEFGNIVKTTDGGATWTVKPSGTTTTLRTVDFINSSTGFVAGGLGTILKTKDGGETWAPVANSGTSQDLINLRFANSTVGFAVVSTSVFSNGEILKTTDGGDNWEVVYTNAQGLLGLAVPSENVIYAAGGNNQLAYQYAVIVKSEDGGATWNEVFQGDDFHAFRAAHFTDEKTGWVVGDGGYVEGTVDGGITWNAFKGATAGMLGIHFPTSDTGYATGTATFIMKTVKILRAADADFVNPVSLNIFPNPATDLFTIALDQKIEGDVVLQISDASGRMVESITAGEERMIQVASNDWPAGMYVVSVVSGNAVLQRQKLIVQ